MKANRAASHIRRCVALLALALLAPLAAGQSTKRWAPLGPAETRERVVEVAAIDAIGDRRAGARNGDAGLAAEDDVAFVSERADDEIVKSVAVHITCGGDGPADIKRAVEAEAVCPIER